MIRWLFRTRFSARAAFIVGIVVFLLDQATKYIAKQSISPFDAITVTSFFSLVYVENLGSAFGMFKSMGVYFFIAVALIAAAIVTYLILKDPENRLAFGLILGGAIGNLTDRIVHGAVIDFFDFYVGAYHWPAFNVADIGLTVGITILLIHAFFIEGRTRKPERL
jgi:signal peptidase II